MKPRPTKLRKLTCTCGHVVHMTARHAARYFDKPLECVQCGRMARVKPLLDEDFVVPHPELMKDAPKKTSFYESFAGNCAAVLICVGLLLVTLKVGVLAVTVGTLIFGKAALVLLFIGFILANQSSNKSRDAVS